VLLGTGYSWFFLILAVLIFPYYFIIKHAMINGITWGVAQYAEHRSDMDFFFGLCFEITHTNFTALAATVFGYLQRNQCVEVDFRAPEIILLVAVVIGLFVMTMCTVPPAAGLPSYRDSFVRRIMKFTVYFLLVLTCSGLFLAVRKICGWYVLLSYIVVVVDVAAYWHEFLQSTIRHIVKVVTRCAEQKGFSGDIESQARAEHAGNSGQISMETSSWRTGHSQKYSQSSPIAAREQSRLLVTFFSIVSGALMVSYSLNISAQSWKHKASLVMMYSAFVAYLGMVVIMREVPTEKASAVAISSALAGLLLLGALLCFIAFILSNPLALDHG
jgi:small-conductance mechanosensitive channel